MGNAEAKKKKQEQQQLKKLEEIQKKIGVAVFFLAGENMDKIPAVQKKIFLRKKGLSQQMVQQAFKRFEAKQKQKKEQKTSQQSNAKGEIQNKQTSKDTQKKQNN